MRRLEPALKRGEIDMTNSMNSVMDAMPRQPERYRRYLSIAAALCLVIMTVASGGRASAAASEAEA
jgi:hypothetical protein